MKKIIAAITAFTLAIGIAVLPSQSSDNGLLGQVTKNFTMTAQAASSAVVGIRYKTYYDKAFDVLDIVNKYRTQAGLSKLTMDKSLMTCALQRAIESSVYFSHTRPNGSDCYSVNESKMSGENLTTGTIVSTGAAAMKLWMNSPSHKANILRDGFKSIGIGCVYVNGAWFWTQSFGYSNASPVATRNAYTNTSGVGKVTIEDSIISPVLNGAASIKVGGSKTYSYSLRNTAFTSATPYIDTSYLTFTSSDKSIATVSSKGVVTAKKKAGSVTITAYVTNHKSKTTVSKKVTVVSGSALSNATITIPSKTYQYTGKWIFPTVTVKIGGNKLIEGKDFSVIYYNSQYVGKASLVVTGKGDYDGSATVNYAIAKRNVSTLKCSLSSRTFGYNGLAKRPTVTVKSGSSTLRNGTDYTVSYVSNTKVGTAYAVISGKGSYTGTKKISFKIIPAKQKIYSISASKSSLSVKYRYSNSSGYQITYANNSSFKSAKTITVSNKSTTSKTIASLSRNKKYYVKVRTVLNKNGKTYYGYYSKVSSVTTK